MGINIEQLELCNSIKKTISELMAQTKSISQPLLNDLALVEPIHAEIRAELAGVSRSIANRVELIVMLYLFSPMLIVSRKKEKNGAFRAIAKAMNTNASNLSKYKATILTYYKNYKDFRELANTTYENILQKIAENSFIENQ